MRRLLATALTLTLAAQSAPACVLPPPIIGAVFVQEAVKGGEWRFVEIGALAMPEQPLFLSLASDGAMRATGLCNDMTGPYKGDAALLTLEPVLEAVAFCDPEIEDFDTRMQAYLRDVTLYSPSDDGQRLYLTTADSQQITLERRTDG